MRNNSNVAALVFIGAPVYIICRYVALAFGYASQRLVVCFPLRVPSAKTRAAIFLFCTNYFNTKTLFAQELCFAVFCGFRKYFFQDVPNFYFAI